MWRNQKETTIFGDAALEKHQTHPPLSTLLQIPFQICIWSKEKVSTETERPWFYFIFYIIWNTLFNI